MDHMEVKYIGPGYSNGEYLGEKYSVNGQAYYVYFPKNVSEN